MPLYSYRCTACESAFEALVRSDDVPVCPSCGSDKLNRLLSMPAAEGKSGELIKRSRAAAGAAGHLSNFSKSRG